MTNAEKALQLHEEWNGKFETTPKMDIATREDLALAYTPVLLNHVRSSQRIRKQLTNTPLRQTLLPLYLTAVLF